MSVTISGNKRIKIIGVPIDLGTKPLGVEMGPTAIRCAGLHEALEWNGIEYVDHGDLQIPQGTNGTDALHQVASVVDNLADLVSEAITDGYLPVILGGDHSASIGSIAGASRISQRLGLIWLDYHPDANTPETSPSGNIHGMTVAISLGYGYPQLVNCGNHSPKVLPEDICIIGAKDIDRDEKRFLEQAGVSMFTISDLEKDGCFQVLQSALHIVTGNTDMVHLSFDIDVLDPAIAPGTGIVSRGGLSYREICYMMQEFGNKCNISSIDIIEINPLMDIKNQTSELAIELLLLALGGSYGDYERNYLK